MNRRCNIIYVVHSYVQSLSLRLDTASGNVHLLWLLHNNTSAHIGPVFTELLDQCLL